MRNAILVGVLGVAVLLFFYSGRSNGGYGDLAPVYGSIRCVLTGKSPYVTENVRHEVVSHGADPAAYPPDYWQRYAMLYPPLTYLLLSPLGLLSFPAAGAVYFWLCGAMYAACYLMFVCWSPRETRLVTALGAACILASSGVLLRLGQVSTPVLALCAFGSLLLLRGRNRSGGFLLLLGACLKPQLVLPLLVFFCIRRQTRKTAAIALGAFTMLSAVALVILTWRLGSLTWVQEFNAQLHVDGTVGPVQRIDTGIVNLSALTTLINPSPAFYQTVDVLVFVGFAGILCVGYFRAAPGEERDWIGLAGMSFFTLLLTYHRTYDMRLQILALPALAMLWRRARVPAAALTLAGALQLFSTAIVLEQWATRRFGEGIAGRLFFRLLIERQQAIFVLVTAIGWTWVLWAAGRRRTGGAVAAVHAERCSPGV